MGQVIVHATMSLDGFIAGPNDEMDWVFKYGGPDEVVDDVMRMTGAVVMGKRTFAVSVKQHQLPYGGAVRVPLFVVTHEARDTLSIDGLTFTCVPEGIERAVQLTITAAGDKNVSLLGGSIDRQCLIDGLEQEFVDHASV